MPPNPLKPPTFWAQLSSLLWIALTNWRWSWRSMLVTGALAPMLSILALSVFARDSGPRALAYVLTGNMVISLMFGTMGHVQNNIVYMRFQGMLDYFATLPVQRALLVLAVMVSFLLLSLPSLVVTLLFGAAYLGVTVHLHPLLLVAIPLCALPLAGIGALVGAWSRTPEEADSINLVITLILAGLGPVVIPPERLQPVWVSLGYLSPATYAASALRQAVLGPVTGRIGLDFAILAAVSALIFGMVLRKLDWRQK